MGLLREGLFNIWGPEPLQGLVPDLILQWAHLRGSGSLPIAGKEPGMARSGYTAPQWGRTALLARFGSLLQLGIEAK